MHVSAVWVASPESYHLCFSYEYLKSDPSKAVQGESRSKDIEDAGPLLLEAGVEIQPVVVPCYQ